MTYLLRTTKSHPLGIERNMYQVRKFGSVSQLLELAIILYGTVRRDTVQAPADVAEGFRAQNFDLGGGLHHVKQGFVVVDSSLLLFVETMPGNGKSAKIQCYQQSKTARSKNNKVSK